VPTKTHPVQITKKIKGKRNTVCIPTLKSQESYQAVNQACQTQTTLRAKKATKTVEGAAKVLKNFLTG